MTTPIIVQSVVSNHKDNFLEWCLRMKIPIVDAVLNWIDPAPTGPINRQECENDKDVNGYTFFTWLGNMETNKILKR